MFKGFSLIFLIGAASLATVCAQPENDNFANATPVFGNVYFPAATVDDATMEPGEPAHIPGIAEKSVWWAWQAPMNGTVDILAQGSTTTNEVMVAYTGDSVFNLTLVAKSNPYFDLYMPSVIGGQTYYIAGAVPADSTGFIQLHTSYSSPNFNSHIVPGNLLQEPSWEGTGINGAKYWHWSGSLGGYVNESGGADGTTWPTLGSGTFIWQDFPTIPGHTYQLQFACNEAGGGEVQISVSWDTNQLGIAVVPTTEGYWHWDTYFSTASNTTSRVTFRNIAGEAAMDAFSVVDVTAPPLIILQPASISSIGGGSATFFVGVTGTSPMSYQWFFGSSPLLGQTNVELILTSLTSTQAGNYQLIVTNVYGAATSHVAALEVDAPASATILSQPYGDTIPLGGYFNLSVVAGGNPPLVYQWFQNGQAIFGATNSYLMLTNVQTTNAGTYTVQVTNQSSMVWSLPATLTVDAFAVGGGVIDFKNKNFFSVVTNVSVPVFDVNGVTLLSGGGYYAQLYAGPSLDLLRPAGEPTPFQTGLNAGYFIPQTITLANVPPGSNAVLQVCAWDDSYGTSYEQARATGGKFGKSGIIQVFAGGDGAPAQTLQGFQSFNLQGGLPYFQVGNISFVHWQPPNVMIWSLQGQSNSIYLVEKSMRSQETIWHPFMVLSNVTGTVTFTDTNSGSGMVWYRARILN